MRKEKAFSPSVDVTQILGPRVLCRVPKVCTLAALGSLLEEGINHKLQRQLTATVTGYLQRDTKHP